MNAQLKKTNAMKMLLVLTMLVAILVHVTLVSKVPDVLVKTSMSARLVTTLALVSMPCARTFQEHMTAAVLTDTIWMLQSFQVELFLWDAQTLMSVLFTVTIAIEIMVSVLILSTVEQVNVPVVRNSPKLNFSPFGSVSMMVRPVSTSKNALEVHLNAIQMQLMSITLVNTLVNATLDLLMTVKHAWTLMNVPDVCWSDLTQSHVM